MAPLFAWPDDRDLTGNNIPQATCTKYDCVGTSTQKAERGLLLHRKYDQLDRTSQVDRRYPVVGSFPANFIRGDRIVLFRCSQQASLPCRSPHRVFARAKNIGRSLRFDPAANA